MTVMHHHCAACGGRETYPEEIICQLSLTELASLSLVLTVCQALGCTLGWGDPSETPRTDEK